ncbi:MAG TPA: MetQ/NlpA family ABC transporter substrate-binding protein [Clostridia bacterium]|nr:MetQ/NlpA family ABC transporter substrate-binding protein [Clostridia bacterium]
MKKLLSAVLALSLLFVASAASAAELTKIKIGATPTPHAEVLELVADDLEALGYDLEIVVFTEYPLPNPALAAGELDANYFQHLPYLDAYNVTVPESEQLVAAFPVHYEPYGIYAGKTKALADLKEGGVVTVTNDPSNETRALLLLQEAGLIKLPEDTTPQSSLTVLDIVDNPLKLDIREVEAATLPATLEDADFAVINGNFALGAGLKPATDAVFLEPADSEAGKTYANYVVVRKADAEADFVKALQQVLQSQKVYDFILNNETYQGGVIPTFAVEAKP